MGRAPVASMGTNGGLNKGPWTEEEDAILTAFIKVHEEGNWRTLPKLAGLQRCRKSCRLRWMNYLRPDLKRGNFSPDEDELIVKLHALLGNRWSLIAGRIPGRTDNEIKNYWNSRLRRKLSTQGKRVEAIPLSCSDIKEELVVSCPIITVCEPTTESESSFPDSYPAAGAPFDSSLFASSEPAYASRFDNEAMTPSSDPCSSSSDGATACNLEDNCSGYSSNYSLDEVAKHEPAHSPESVLAQIEFDSGDDFYGYDFTNGLADLGDTNFQKLLQLSPMHKNNMATTAGWSSWPNFYTSDYGNH